MEIKHYQDPERYNRPSAAEPGTTGPNLYRDGDAGSQTTDPDSELRQNRA